MEPKNVNIVLPVQYKFLWRHWFSPANVGMTVSDGQKLTAN